ncbi:uncharacterized protein PGTG_16809 [Puccinia graminis f. sp. tritici CRL 75-36-700-3]|uniref:Uncharacterized protein n=1 Tax=Puccinia graminis f. sp. tritici (strain CRL 75-36-700-3 / race SCCL) TaxID=418459 RepID=E3L2N2_PUCGT|nr:uncharacterized protein PGTG_16809 [Puccinia graminis f. sp. tritici CRL 75-36-700-3]EFP90783.1 hypothetical protein PGTG_16809 [Puccinia graminis f. sp. tritici CRL 75-36-700-3]
MFKFITNIIEGGYSDLLHFEGFFKASHTLMTHSSIPPGRLDLGSDDHRDLRLVYKTSTIPKLTRGKVYWSQGAVVGCSRHEMPFLQCHELECPQENSQSITREIINITGVGTIVAKIDSQGGFLDLFVQHEVGIRTAFGDKVIMVKYVVNKSQCGEGVSLLLKPGQRGQFMGVLAGWDRNNGTMVVDAPPATIKTFCKSPASHSVPSTS